MTYQPHVPSLVRPLKPLRQRGGTALAALALAVTLPLAPMPLWAAEAANIAPAEAPKVSAPAISVVAVKTANLRERIFASGTIEPVELVTVAPQVEGQRTEELLAEVGDYVEQGQVLAVLSNDALILQRAQLEAQRTAAQAAVAQSEATLLDSIAASEEAVRVNERTVKLKADGAVSQAAADKTATAAASALARVSASEQGLAAARAQAALVDVQIENVELSIARTRIKAPVAGVISARNAQLGAIASAAGQPMFVLFREGLLELYADVSEQDITALLPGQTVEMRTVGTTTPLSGHIRLVEPTVGATTRLGRARIALDDSRAVRAGLFAEAEILVQEAEVLAVPVTAVSAGSDGITRALRVDANGRVEQVIIETGVRDGGLIGVISGLAAGDQVVARAGAFVRPGDLITPVALASDQ